MLCPKPDDSKHASVQEFMDYIEKGVFDAFSKGFVDRIMLNIHDEDPSKKVRALLWEPKQRY